jgi:hypothetical protein
MDAYAFDWYSADGLADYDSFDGPQNGICNRVAALPHLVKENKCVAILVLVLLAVLAYFLYKRYSERKAQQQQQPQQRRSSYYA